MTLLITGGAGFIGASLVQEAVARGYEVAVLDALTYAGHPQNLENVKDNITLIEGDVCDRKTVDTCLANHHVTGIIHAAAESHVDNAIASSAKFLHTNIHGTHSMLESARAYYDALTSSAKASFRFLQISTDEVYGALGIEGTFRQSSPILPNSPYAASKAAADHLVRSWGVTYDLPVLITRCCNNYGPRQHPEKLIPRMLISAMEGDPLPVYGNGQQMREWIHVADHAAAVFAVYENAAIGSLTHIGTGVEFSNLSLVHVLCKILETHGIDARGQITHVTDRAGHDFRYALSLEENEITLPNSRDFLAGLNDTVAWYLAHPNWLATMRAHTKHRRQNL